MDKLVVNGPCKLNGEIRVSAAKNAALPIMAATILFPEKMEFNNLPGLSDIQFFADILEDLGATIDGEGSTISIDGSTIDKTIAEYELVRKMRASVLVLGPLLSRFKTAEVSLPGGCAIGSRPVDIHLSALEKMGAKINIENGYIKAQTDGLKGANIEFSFPSVGATENIMMAAVWAEGITIIDNAAREPEIVDLAKFLSSFGVQIEGAGTSRIKITGQFFLTYKPAVRRAYSIIGDRIEAATYIAAGLITNSEITVKGFNPKHIQAVIDVMKKMGAQLEVGSDFVKTFSTEEKLKGVSFETAPYPGFPTDAQAQLMSLAGVVSGNTIISEKIFENRFMHVPELVRLGMNIKLDGHSAIVQGGGAFKAAPVMCTDLRASAALILTALVSAGETHISRVYHLDRGYEKIENKLIKLGVDIRRSQS